MFAENGTESSNFERGLSKVDLASAGTDIAFREPRYLESGQAFNEAMTTTSIHKAIMVLQAK